MIERRGVRPARTTPGRNGLRPAIPKPAFTKARLSSSLGRPARPDQGGTAVHAKDLTGDEAGLLR